MRETGFDTASVASNQRLVGLLATLAFFLMAAGWALALPVNGTYDEKQHIVRAYAVVTGQWLPVARTVDPSGHLPTDALRAPRSLLPGDVDCTWYPRDRRPEPASCQRQVTDRSLADLPSGAARYSPVYYLLVGLPLRWLPDQTGVLVARLLSALLSAVLLGAAAGIAARLGNRLLLVALVLVGTPMVMNLYGSVNPNGLEISAGALLFVALLGLLRPPEHQPASSEPGPASSDPPPGAAAPATGRALLVAAGVAGLLLLTVRQLGPLLFLAVVAVCLLVARRAAMARLVRDRVAWIVLGVPVVAGAGFTAFWYAYSRVGSIAPVAGRGLPYGPLGILRRIPGARLDFYVQQVVGQFGYGETTMSRYVILAWYALFVVLVVPALWFGGTRLRLAIIGVLVVCAGLLAGLEMYFGPKVGWFSHARYVLPVAVGAVLLAAFAEEFTAFLRARGWLGPLVVLVALATIPLDMYALARVMTRYQVGIAAGLNPLGGSWRPQLGPLPPLLAALAGAVLLVAVVAVVALAAAARPALRPAGSADSATGSGSR